MRYSKAILALVMSGFTCTQVASQCISKKLEVPSGYFSEITHLSKNGTVYGYIWHPTLGGASQYTWNQNGKRIEIKIALSPDATSGLTTDGNKKNSFAGNQVISGKLHSTRWIDGKPTLLEVPPNFDSSYATQINKKGTVIGGGVANFGRFVRAYQWSTDGTPKELSTSGENNSSATAINDQGVIVGSIYNSLDSFPVFWKNGKLNYLPDNGYPLEKFALDINNSGDIVGSLGGYQGGPVPFPVMWPNGGTEFYLGGLYPEAPGSAKAINDAGVIVGYSHSTPYTKEAFVWSNGVMTSLNKLMPGSFSSSGNVLFDAVGVSGTNIIAANGFRINRDESTDFFGLILHKCIP